MKLFIKYIVSIRCKMIVKSELEKLGLHHGVVELGEVEVKESITSEQRDELKENLIKSGLELMDDKKAILIERIKAGIYAEGVTEVFKIAIGRTRPYADEGAFHFHPFTIIDDKYHSMPSGHTTAAMALSTVMSRHAPTTFLKILAYVPAGFTIFSRTYQKQHWLSDVIPAAAIGYFAGNWVVDLHEGKRHRINVTSVYPPGISYGFK
jgi:hypothetical protein